MYILQLSDLHLSKDSNIDELRNKTNLLTEKISRLISENNSQIVCCVLGDFIDKGEAEAFNKASEILKLLNEKLNQIFGIENVRFIFVPGNHDLCSERKKEKTLSAYNEFVSQFFECKIDDISDLTVQETEIFGYSFISVNSVRKNQHKYGQIDFNRLNEAVKNPYTIMLTHHSLISSDEDDDASIRDGYKLLKFIEDNRIISLLHGHTHGCKRYSVGEEQQIIGVGPMFKNVEDISNQCNLIQIAGRNVREINTLTYHADRLSWDAVLTYKRVQDSNYVGTSVFKVYSDVLEDANTNYFLPNLRMEIKQSFNSFEEEIRSKFNHALADAELWQKESPDTSLEYTHCELMNTEHKKWDDFVIETLRQNPTSKRAIVPLIDKSMAFKGGDDRLVSFDIVQFGFPDEKYENLNITIYLRALELRYFLPVNLCETYIMAQKIRNAFRSINDVTICIFAFRGEAKDEYGCYRKSKLDIITESEICKLFSDKNTIEIKHLLSEKISMSDTVINGEWLTKIKNAVIAFCEEKEKILNQITIVEKNLAEYKEVRKVCSNYFSTKKQEDILKSSIAELSNLVETLNEE